MFAKNKTGDEFAEALARATALEVGQASFAGYFQRALFCTAGLTNEIHARTLPVRINDDGRKLTVPANLTGNTNIPKGVGDTKQPHSKIIFTIQATNDLDLYAQTMVFAYADNYKASGYYNELKEECGETKEEKEEDSINIDEITAVRLTGGTKR